jgi:hypothetical protein
MPGRTEDVVIRTPFFSAYFIHPFLNHYILLSLAVRALSPVPPTVERTPHRDDDDDDVINRMRPFQIMAIL